MEAFIIMSIVAVNNFRRKGLLNAFKKAEATNVENAVTIQDINEKWELLGIKPLREHITQKDLDFLLKRKKLIMTDDDKYYLPLK
jgi:hypothetical protein